MHDIGATNRWNNSSRTCRVYNGQCITISLVRARGLRVEHFYYPTRTRNTELLPVPVPDPYSKLLPDPTRTRGYSRTRKVPVTSLTRLLIVPVPTRPIGLQLSM